MASLEQKIGRVLDGKDKELFDRGYLCEKAGVMGDWDGPSPPTPPDNSAPAFLLGRAVFLCDFVRPKLPSESQYLFDIIVP